MKIILFILLMGAGTLFLAKTNAVVGITGRVGWAERNLGAAGTFTLYKLIGVACLIISLMMITGVFDRLLGGLVGGFVGNLNDQR